MGRAIVLLILTAAVAAGLVLSQSKTFRARRAPSGFIGSFELAPIVDGALPGGSDAAGRTLTGERSTTRFWRRQYAEASFVMSAPLDRAQVAPFVRAVRDSIERRLADAKATVRGVSSTNWPDDSLDSAGGGGPMALTVPYATRRRAGWVAVRTQHAGDGGFTMWVSLFEGPRPGD